LALSGLYLVRVFGSRPAVTSIQNDKADSLTEEALIKLPPYVRRAPQPWATEAAAKLVQQLPEVKRPPKRAREDENEHLESEPALKSLKEENHDEEPDMAVQHKSLYQSMFDVSDTFLIKPILPFLIKQQYHYPQYLEIVGSSTNRLFHGRACCATGNSASQATIRLTPLLTMQSPATKSTLRNLINTTKMSQSSAVVIARNNHHPRSNKNSTDSEEESVRHLQRRTL
jgi:hypothetical protein